MRRLVPVAVLLAALLFLTSCSGCIGIIDFGDPGEGRPIDLPDAVEETT